MEQVFSNGLWPRRLWHGAKDVERAFVGKGFRPVLIRGTVCVCTQHPRIGNVPGKYGRHGELFFFLLMKEPTVIFELVEFGPCFSAETVKTCALIGLHMTAEENALRSDSDSSPDPREIWRYGCPKVRFGATTASKRKEVRMLLLLSITCTTSVISPLKWLGSTGQVN